MLTCPCAPDVLLVIGGKKSRRQRATVTRALFMRGRIADGVTNFEETGKRPHWLGSGEDPRSK